MANESSTWRLLLGVGACLALAAIGCRRDQQPPPRTVPVALPGSTNFGITPIELPQIDAKPGAAVAILVDTSGSMGAPVTDKGGTRRPKHQIARAALEDIVGHTAKWAKANPERKLQMGIYNFSSHVATVLPMGDFAEGKARSAIGKMPQPGGGTAIGVALEEGFKELYRSGCVRKYVICVTDGENTAGLPPDRVARQLHAQTKGEVEIHFVAFDVSGRHFAFAKGVNGHVVEASDGTQLRAELTRIYDQRILVEAEDPDGK
jgi:Mg-chelatase subunit ChlD